MTTQGMFTRFQKLMQETSTRFFGTAWAIETMNDSVQDVFEEVRSINPEMLGMGMVNSGYTTGVREPSPSPLPAGTVFIEKVEVTDLGGPPFPTLNPIDFRQVGQLAVPYLSIPGVTTGGGQSEPLNFYTRQPDGASAALVIGFDPVPQRTASNNLNIWYNVLPSDIGTIDNSTTVDLPLDLHRLVPLRMAILACGADSSPRSQFFTGLYNTALQNALLKAAKGRSGAREQIQVVD